MDNTFFEANKAITNRSNLKARINIEKCKRCYKCVSRCPYNAIVMGEKGYPKVDPTKCVGCQLCKKNCIDFYYETQNNKDFQTKSNNDLIKTVEKFLEKYNLLQESTKLMVGFSGGYDSCALLYALNSLKEKYKLTLCAAHLNHGWREEANNEELNCKEFCKKYDINFYSEKLDESVNKTETAAREARYEFFIRAAKHFNTKNILTAHNKNDVAETLIYRISKGTGVKGLCGIEEKRVCNNIMIYRPILSIERDEIENFCNENKLMPNNDSSNFNTKYKRNFIRHEIIPMLKNINPNIQNAINSLYENAKENEQIINEYLNVVKKDIFNNNKIKTNKFIKLSTALKQRLIYDLIIERNLEYDRKKILEIIDFIEASANAKTGKTLSITNNLWLFCSQKELYFINSEHKKNEEVIQINDFSNNNEYFIDNYKFSIEKFNTEEKIIYPKDNENIAYVDLSNQKYLELRFRKQGDKIQPFGMKNIIKLKDFFINKGIPKHKKDRIVLLCNDTEVLWACTVGLSEKLRVTSKPTHIIKIEEV